MKIAVLVSGGVDSSVALARLREQGHDLTAFYLKIWLEDELSFLGDCPWEQDLRYARSVCEQLDVPLEVVSMQQAYHDRVVSYVVNEVRSGRTPNPDVLCNRHIKFGLFWDHLMQAYACGKKGTTHFDAVASGHYAQIAHESGGVRLMQSPDPIKDQTYFLAYMHKEQLARAMFPIGDMPKDQVRAYAQRLGLATQDRKDSQGICFLGKFKFRDFIRHHVGERVGEIREYETNTVLGEHKGFWFYTIGQRQGIGLSGGPWYVVDKDTKGNIVYVSRAYYEPDKERSMFLVRDCNWIGKPAQNRESLQVKLRHGAQMYTCVVQGVGTTLRVQLTDRDQGIAAGQFAAFYRGAECIGSGIITHES